MSAETGVRSKTQVRTDFWYLERTDSSELLRGEPCEWHDNSAEHMKNEIPETQEHNCSIKTKRWQTAQRPTRRGCNCNTSHNSQKIKTKPPNTKLGYSTAPKEARAHDVKPNPTQSNRNRAHAKPSEPPRTPIRYTTVATIAYSRRVTPGVEPQAKAA